MSLTKIKNFFRYAKIKLMPKTLFLRFMLIITLPVIILQIISLVVFFDNHWTRIARRLSTSLTGEFKQVIYQIENSRDYQEVIAQTKQNLGLNVSIEEQGQLKIVKESNLDDILYNHFRNYMEQEFGKNNFAIEYNQKQSIFTVSILQNNKIVNFTIPQKRIFSWSTYLFVAWMIATSVLLIVIAMMFMRIQVRSIKRLANTAERFGRGLEVEKFKPEGSSEVRAAASAFLRMKDRIKRQVTERTRMLAGVSHDLKTPITRMKLQLAMMQEDENINDLNKDINDMEKMIEGYLSFARGEGKEASVPCNINGELLKIIRKYNKQKNNIDYHKDCSKELVDIRPNSFNRCIDNIISNARRYATKIEIELKISNDELNIIIDDNGPGIPADKREEVFRPFFRLDDSRNPETGGVGLGLSISKDVIHSHGGEIKLEDSPIGGLRVNISIPA